MNIEKTIQEDRQAKLTVDYTNLEFESFKHRAARRIAKDTKIPGFRPGKAPYNVILNRYGEAAIIQEAIDILLDDDYAKILDQAEIKPSGVGSLETIESFDPPKFVFMVPLEPEIELNDYKEMRKKYEPDEFDTAQVDEFIENLRRNAATIIPAEHPAEVGNLVYFNLSGEFLNPKEDEDASITDKTPQQVIIPAEGEGSEREWPFPGFAQQLLGVSAGESKELQHTYADDAEDEDYRGKTAVFSVDVQSVKELELPEVDEDFIKSMGDYESPEAFRDSIEEHLRKDQQEEYDNKFFNDLLAEIIEQATIIYPPQMLEHEEEHVLDDIKNRLSNQKLDFETYLKLRETDEETFIKEEVEPVAKQRLERSLVVDELIAAEGLKLDQEMLKQNINQVMAEVYYSGNVQDMQKQLGQDDFSRAISMEGVQRTMSAQLQERLKLIATGQPIPEDEPETDSAPEDAEEKEVVAQASENEAEVETADTPEVIEPVDEASEPESELEETSEELIPEEKQRNDN
ncbi:MAG TPA: trigger factor [Anaerolineaceae bacterium]|nr:trigger factor [Anaerolineaceae bacterium]